MGKKLTLEELPVYTGPKIGLFTGEEFYQFMEEEENGGLFGICREVLDDLNFDGETRLWLLKNGTVAKQFLYKSDAGRGYPYPRCKVSVSGLSYKKVVNSLNKINREVERRFLDALAKPEQKFAIVSQRINYVYGWAGSYSWADKQMKDRGFGPEHTFYLVAPKNYNPKTKRLIFQERDFERVLA